MRHHNCYVEPVEVAGNSSQQACHMKNKVKERV